MNSQSGFGCQESFFTLELQFQNIISPSACLPRHSPALSDDGGVQWGRPLRPRDLNQAVKRHKKRFPEDFMFQLSKSEYDFLISQFVTSKKSANTERRNEK